MLNLVDWSNVADDWSNVADDWPNVADDWSNVADDWSNVADDWSNVTDDWSNVAVDWSNFAGEQIYYIGIVNISQEYNTQKQIENKLKYICGNRDASCVSFTCGKVPYKRVCACDIL